MRLTRFIAAVLVAGGLGLPSAALADPDHLQGYRVKDLDKIRPPGTYTINGDFGTANCTLKKAKFVLMQGEKNGGDDPRGGAAGEFVCYTATCTGGLPAAPTMEVDDQFGTHTMELKKTQIICAPADKFVCGDGDLDPGEQCDGAAGPCPLSCTASCTCAPAACQATTGGFCWYLGAPMSSCTATCAGAFRVYDAATDTFAGSAGTDANCTQVLTDLGTAGPPAMGTACGAGTGIGCAFGVVGFRCTTPPTNANDVSAARRACACQ